MPVEIKVPDIGDFKDIPIIEVHVSAGQKIAVDDPLLTLESDKATMDVPSPQAGTVAELKVKLGDKVSQGSVILTLEAEGAAAIPPKERINQGASPSTAEPAGYGSPGRRSTRRSRSRSRTSATSRASRSSRSTSPPVPRSRRTIRCSRWRATRRRWTSPRRPRARSAR